MLAEPPLHLSWLAGLRILVFNSFYSWVAKLNLPANQFYLMLAWGAVDSCGSWKCHRVALGPGAVVILAGLLLLARIQTSYWKDSLTLWTHDLACTPENSLAPNALGLALFNQGKLDEAVQHYK